MRERRATVAVVIVSAVFLAAPTPGDVGACGKTAQEMSSASFAAARKRADCAGCTACGIVSDRCVRACNEKLPPEIALPPTCRPLIHDGEVCLRAINDAPCDRFATYVDEFAPATPSECTFCLVPPPPPPGSFAGPDAGDGGEAGP